MPLCEHMLSASIFGVIQGVRRLETPEGVTFLVSCRPCGDIHRVDVPMNERPALHHQEFQEFWAWLISVHVPRERKKAMDIQALLIAQTPSEVRAALLEFPEPKPTIADNPQPLPKKLAA